MVAVHRVQEARSLLIVFQLFTSTILCPAYLFHAADLVPFFRLKPTRYTTTEDDVSK